MAETSLRIQASELTMPETDVNSKSTKNILKLIAGQGTNVDSGMTALRWAAEGGHDNTVKVLLDAGADVIVADNNSKNHTYASKHYLTFISHTKPQPGKMIEGHHHRQGQGRMVHTICEWISQTLGGFSSDLQEMKVGFSRDLQEMKVGFSRDLQEMQALIHSQKSELEEAKEKIKRLREKSEFKPVQGMQPPGDREYRNQKDPVRRREKGGPSNNDRDLEEIGYERGKWQHREGFQFGHLQEEKETTDKGSSNERGGTALYFAAARGHDNTVKVLLDAGADINVADNIVLHTT
ncbi:uncharacterized protein [Procambarus clarkii]|uniref:uncharacterized protein n=1 Tax=Procambarus clarkii TaxID=6728 RepID=UPI003741FFD7